MKQGNYEILRNEPIAPGVLRLVLKGDTSALTAPGQFVNMELPGHYLRRPLSVCRRDAETLTVVYKVVGCGTQDLANLRPGDRLDLLCGLGNGFDLARSGDTPLLIGGGVGTPPLLWLSEALLAQGKRPSVLLGFNTKAEVILEDAFRALGMPVSVATVDGSYGTKGFVTELLPAPECYSYYFACGPIPMLQAVHDAAATSGQISLEERMGCGFGACMGCTVETKNGPKRLCREGPVLESGELPW
jgi:dihydroorotate dehydrogenase electron transfer subunit